MNGCIEESVDGREKTQLSMHVAVAEPDGSHSKNGLFRLMVSDGTGVVSGA